MLVAIGVRLHLCCLQPALPIRLLGATRMSAMLGASSSTCELLRERSTSETQSWIETTSSFSRAASALKAAGVSSSLQHARQAWTTSLINPNGTSPYITRDASWSRGFLRALRGGLGIGAADSLVVLFV